MDPPPKRRKLNVSKRQERNRLAPLFRYLATADDSNSDSDYGSSNSNSGNTVTSGGEGTQILSQYLEENDNGKDNQPPKSNEGETCAATSSEEDASSASSDTDRYYESDDSYESNSCSDSELNLFYEDEGWLQSESDDEEYVVIDSDYCRSTVEPSNRD